MFGYSILGMQLAIQTNSAS